MSSRAMPSVARVFAGLGLAFVVGVAGVLTTPVDASAAPLQIGGRYNDLLTWMSIGTKLAAPIFGGSPEGSPGAISTGQDGRLTILLIGSDTRGTGLQRTDTIMIASVKNKVMTAASIPRDTARILNPFTANPNDYFKGKVNTILKQLKKTRSTTQALLDFEKVIANELNIEIDGHVLITFNGFQNLVDEIDPINVRIDHAIKDTKFWDNPYKTRGVYFPVASSYDLYAWQPNADPALCDGSWRSYSNPPSNTWCRRAIVFVRSRKGTGNSDFKRAVRQQDLVAGAVKAVLGRGSGANLTALVNNAKAQSAKGYLYSANFDISTVTAAQIWDRVNGATVGPRVVFAPNTYSTHIKGTSSYQLKLDAVRAWASANLK
jgi:anionic cell wall polymer biosynthesis LytR-Cps2A-Psr (LCP) family protein